MSVLIFLGNQTTIKRTKLCGEGSASGRSTKVKKLICGEYREVFCQQSSNERRLHEDHVDKKDTTMIVIKENILPQNKFLRIEFNPVSGDPLALRFLHVQERPARTGCRVIPETGVELLQNFRLSCNDLGHKVLYSSLRNTCNGCAMVCQEFGTGNSDQLVCEEMKKVVFQCLSQIVRGYL